MASAASYALLRQRLSGERLAPYEQVTAGVDQAQALYEWNMAISGALFETVGAFEVVLRNALHDQLRAHYAIRHGATPWYRAAPLDVKGKEDVEKAVDRATSKGRTAELEGKVVAELTLGFWRYLFSRKYQASIWPFIKPVFLNLPASADRQTVESHVQRVHFLRNRIAHHEPIHRRRLADDYGGLLEVVGWICGETRYWIAGISRVPAVLAARP